MSEIFLSYASADRPRIKSIVEALEKCGWSVFWDPTILPGKTWRKEIEAALDAALCVVVVWSETSIEAHWVHEEAGEGQRRGILVPVLLDDVAIPLGYRNLQAANLVPWDGTLTHAEFDKLVKAISGYAPLAISTAVSQGLQQGEGQPAHLTPTTYNRDSSGQTIASGFRSLLPPPEVGMDSPRILVAHATSRYSLAVQLSQALRHRGFLTEVNGFLSPLSRDATAPGVDYLTGATNQVTILRKQLSDFHLMLLIESSEISQWDWIAYQVHLAKTLSVGVLAVHLPDSGKVDGLDPVSRVELFSADFETDPSLSNSTLRAAPLDQIVVDVSRRHSDALIRRLSMLLESVESALMEQNLDPKRTNDGAIVVLSPAGKEYVIRLTPRPFSLVDAGGHTATDYSPGATEIIIGVAPCAVTSILRNAQAHFFDESQIRKAAALMARGLL